MCMLLCIQTLMNVMLASHVITYALTLWEALSVVVKMDIPWITIFALVSVHKAILST